MEGHVKTMLPYSTIFITILCSFALDVVNGTLSREVTNSTISTKVVNGARSQESVNGRTGEIRYNKHLDYKQGTQPNKGSYASTGTPSRLSHTTPRPYVPVIHTTTSTTLYPKHFYQARRSTVGVNIGLALLGCVALIIAAAFIAMLVSIIRKRREEARLSPQASTENPRAIRNIYSLLPIRRPKRPNPTRPLPAIPSNEVERTSMAHRTSAALRTQLNRIAPAERADNWETESIFGELPPMYSRVHKPPSVADELRIQENPTYSANVQDNAYHSRTTQPNSERVHVVVDTPRVVYSNSDQPTQRHVEFDNDIYNL